jgi:2-(1,2-epoxy-1,2-dihydrophenyl)acetyl-CoA isomerase
MRKIAERIVRSPARAIANAKRMMNASLGNSLVQQLELEALSFSDCAATEDFVEGIRAFTEKRRAKFK